jgi:hypothetical protein
VYELAARAGEAWLSNSHPVSEILRRGTFDELIGALEDEYLE